MIIMFCNITSGTQCSLIIAANEFVRKYSKHCWWSFRAILGLKGLEQEIVTMHHMCFQLMANSFIHSERSTAPVGLVFLDERVAGDEVAGYRRRFHPSAASSYTDTPSSSATSLAGETHPDQWSFKTFPLWYKWFHFRWKLHILQGDKWAAIIITQWEMPANQQLQDASEKETL